MRVVQSTKAPYEIQQSGASICSGMTKAPVVLAYRAILSVHYEQNLIPRRTAMRVLFILIPFTYLCSLPVGAQTFLGDLTDVTTSGPVAELHVGESVVHVSFPREDIVRVDFLNPASSRPDTSFSVIQPVPSSPSPGVFISDSLVVVSSAEIQVVCTKRPFRMSYYSNGTQLAAEPPAGGLGYGTTGKQLAFELPPDMHLYGSGERGIGLDLRGHAFNLLNTQTGGYSTPLSVMNINIPLLVTTGGIALFVDNTFPGRFDLGATDPHQFWYRAPEGQLTFYLIASATISGQLEGYTWLTGRQPLPPRWAFGYIQSKYGYRNEAEARQTVDLLRQHQIPCDALVLDLYWFNEMGDLSWNLSAFPSPFTMMRDFLQEGIRTILITEPYVVSQSLNFAEGDAGGYFATTSFGQTYLLPGWWSCGCNAALVDMSSEDARTWWWSKHPSFLGDEVAGLWTDLGEPERHPSDMMHALGSADRVHNIYNLLWAGAVYSGMTALRPGQRVFNLTRSGFAGIQRYGVIPWSGDVARSFGGLAVQPPMMLNSGMSGLAYHNSDIGGFCCGTTTPELYARWMQYGTLCPIARAHGTGQGTEPWTFGAAAENISRSYIELRYRLLPYLYTLAFENFNTGNPNARALVMRYPDDPVAATSSDSYLLGDALLVSPVVQEGQFSKDVYLPDGGWFDYWSDHRHEGKRIVTVATPLDVTPIFVRAGSILPLAPLMQHTDERPLDTLTVAIYPDGEHGGTFTLYEDDGATLDYQSGAYAETEFAQSVSSAGNGNALMVTIGASSGMYQGMTPLRVYLLECHGVSANPGMVTVNGIPVAERTSPEDLRSAGKGFLFDPAGQQLYVHLPGTRDSTYEVIVDNIQLTTSVRVQSSPSFFLHDCYPNPFNPTTHIRYSIGERTMVRLDIYDVLGRLVATSVDAVQDRGDYEVVFDVRTGTGGEITSGVYFFRLRAGNFTDTKKMVFLR
jgi:alpha-glucosidase (family GH31 glycosyl hydrolase)